MIYSRGCIVSCSHFTASPLLKTPDQYPKTRCIIPSGIDFFRMSITMAKMAPSTAVRSCAHYWRSTRQNTKSWHRPGGRFLQSCNDLVSWTYFSTILKLLEVCKNFSWGDTFLDLEKVTFSFIPKQITLKSQFGRYIVFTFSNRLERFEAFLHLSAYFFCTLMKTQDSRGPFWRCVASRSASGVAYMTAIYWYMILYI